VGSIQLFFRVALLRAQASISGLAVPRTTGMLACACDNGAMTAAFPAPMLSGGGDGAVDVN
jgi:hypothetical protein